MLFDLNTVVLALRDVERGETKHTHTHTHTHEEDADESYSLTINLLCKMYTTRTYDESNVTLNQSYLEDVSSKDCVISLVIHGLLG